MHTRIFVCSTQIFKLGMCAHSVAFDDLMPQHETTGYRQSTTWRTWLVPWWCVTVITVADMRIGARKFVKICVVPQNEQQQQQCTGN